MRSIISFVLFNLLGGMAILGMDSALASFNLVYATATAFSIMGCVLMFKECQWMGGKTNEN